MEASAWAYTISDSGWEPGSITRSSRRPRSGWTTRRLAPECGRSQHVALRAPACALPAADTSIARRGAGRNTVGYDLG